MPLYDVSLVFRTLPRAQLIETVKTAASQIHALGGVIRKLDFLGERQLPQRMIVLKLEDGESHLRRHVRIAVTVSPDPRSKP